MMIPDNCSRAVLDLLKKTSIKLAASVPGATRGSQTPFERCAFARRWSMTAVEKHSITSQCSWRNPGVTDPLGAGKGDARVVDPLGARRENAGVEDPLSARTTSGL